MARKRKAVALRYVGSGAWLPGVPAADHEATPEEAEGRIASGLYERAEGEHQAAGEEGTADDG